MLRAVSHYLMGRVAAAGLIHNEIKFTGRSFDYIYSPDGKTLSRDIDTAKEKCLQDCEEMLKDPVPIKYSHRENYHLTSEDRAFLIKFYKKAKDSNWRNSEEIERIKSDMDTYAPHEGF